MKRPLVTMSMRGPVAVVTVDDGAQNALNPRLLNALLGVLKEAQDQAGAVVIAGRPGCFSVGADPEAILEGAETAIEMFHAGMELILRVVESPRPVVAACTGHSLGAAATALLCCDVRIGAAGDYEIGTDVVALGMPVSELAFELARSRLSPRHVVMAVNGSQLYSPAEAVEAGFLDYVTTTDVVEEACEVAADLVQRLDPGAFEITRERTCRWLTDVIIRSAGELSRRTRSVQHSSERIGQ